jgi:replicative superfamily II helicase
MYASTLLLACMFCRCVYIAPLESLAKERFTDWSKRFGQSLGLSVVQLTGEAQADLKLLEKVGGCKCMPHGVGCGWHAVCMG